jgi:hypothetical protein
LRAAYYGLYIRQHGILHGREQMQAGGALGNFSVVAWQKFLWSLGHFFTGNVMLQVSRVSYHANAF